MADKFIIKNDLQYKLTKESLEKFETAVSALQNQPLNGIHPRLRQAEIEGLQSKIGDFMEEIAEYEKNR